MKNKLIPKTNREAKPYEMFYASPRQGEDITSLFDTGKNIEKNGAITIETVYALANTSHAYLTSDVSEKISWSHVRSQSGGGKGLAMMVYGKLFTWENAKEAPGMHYRIDV